MANEVIEVVRRPRVFKLFTKVDMAESETFHTRRAIGRFRSMEIYGKVLNVDAGTPVVTMVINAVRPQAPTTDPVAAADKVALAQQVVTTGAGIAREAYGPDETDPTLPDDVEFVITMTGGSAQGDYEAWMVLHD